MLKGYCHAGEVDIGFQILEKMTRETKLKPDEIMFNSLLDGCAQKNKTEEAMELLEKMEKSGVIPSKWGHGTVGENGEVWGYPE